ncbi:hypothetical protein SH580_17975 [Coraliomargarita algicola]|uniref:Uncharacterized protein n=1 Tax=Coraliomargarita algicola TaxID=3092156 RepID=A0ABZ0RGZ9_9BACT|nr:hypothetical protein [Coraliomargarita sp. J2-16]WPJ95312.1 hypothetical protein SH580_17975 [Coraliomargarita sp. J2-16]
MKLQIVIVPQKAVEAGVLPLGGSARTTFTTQPHKGGTPTFQNDFGT